jgi:DNA-binding winged helix-turn-helix (wHTH) protein
VTFGPFCLDESARQLSRDGLAVHLSPKAFDLLALLVNRRPAAVPKSEAHEALWPATFVADINLAVLIAEIRAALGESAQQPCFIRTLHRFGYAFVGPAIADAAPSRPSMYVLVWATGRAFLKFGDNVIGRDSTADVCVDTAGVSRRHAKIVVLGEEVTVCDLSSKNGTFIGDVRVTTPVSLTDGALLRLGMTRVHFRRVKRDSTETEIVPSRA